MGFMDDLVGEWSSRVCSPVGEGPNLAVLADTLLVRTFLYAYRPASS